VSSPGKYLVDLAKYLEEFLTSYGREVTCCDLAVDSSIVPLQLKDECGLVIDVGPDQNYFRSIDLNDGSIQYMRLPDGRRGWRFFGLVRVTAPYPISLDDCCHYESRYSYEFTNTVAIASEGVARFLEENADGESTQTVFTKAYNGGSVTVSISFSMRVCLPDPEALMAEEAILIGELDELGRR